MSDGAGEVVAVGPVVDGLQVGDRVMGAFHPGWPDGPPTPEAKHRLPVAAKTGGCGNTVWTFLGSSNG